jgi:hypothetical protein
MIADETFGDVLGMASGYLIKTVGGTLKPP